MASYLIRVDGRLSSQLLDAFPTLRAEVAPVQTTLTGVLPDQGALTGVLNHLDELGVAIVEVVRVSDGESEEHGQEQWPGRQRGPRRNSGQG